MGERGGTGGRAGTGGGLYWVWWGVVCSVGNADSVRTYITGGNPRSSRPASPPYSPLLPGPFIHLPLLPQSQPILPGIVNPGCAAAANNIHPGYFIHLPQGTSRSVFYGLLFILFHLPYSTHHLHVL